MNRRVLNDTSKNSGPKPYNAEVNISQNPAEDVSQFAVLELTLVTNLMVEYV